MSKLTAAIDILRELNGPADTITEDGKYDDALRILEAAEGVDRNRAITALTWIPMDHCPSGLRALIESLPEEETKEISK